MGCCKCSCTKKLKHVDQVIHDYDPQENFLNYDVTTVWINRKTKRAWLLVSKEGGIAIWQPIPLEQSAIDKIILDCGEVTPNEKGEIIHRGQCGARTVDDDCKDFCITVNTSWGIEGGKTVCAGESIDLKLKPQDANIITSNVVDASDGDSVVLDGDSGKVLRKAEQWRIGDTGNSWSGKYNQESKNFFIFPDDKSDNPILTMLPNGVTLMPWQPKVGAILGTTPYLGVTNQDVPIGSNKAFEIKLDQDGYNLSAGTFFPGDGAGQGSYYITKYDNAFYIIAYKFIVQKKDSQSSATVNIKIRYLDEYYPVRVDMPANISLATLNDFIIIRSKADEKMTFDIYSTNADVRIDDNQGSGAARNNYLGIYMLG